MIRFDSVDVLLHGSVKTDVPGSPGWSGKMWGSVDQRLDFCWSIFFGHMDFMWISHDFHSCCVVFSSIFQKHLTIKVWGPLRHFEMCNIFLFRALKRSASSLPTCWQIDFTVGQLDWKANFSQIYAPEDAHQPISEGRNQSHPKVEGFWLLQLFIWKAWLLYCPITLIKCSSHFPLHCFWNFDGGMGWRGRMLVWALRKKQRVRSLLGRDGWKREMLVIQHKI